ncbi:MAG TPA: hypothetical protein VNC62_07125 [Burkholderiales bacterium]|nr:hypothetical protein [Burkholderiales bacterium]
MQFAHPEGMKKSPKPTGSTTNASDAVDDVKLPPNPTTDEKLDEGIEETFPASDPVSIAHPSETAYEREQRLKKRNGKKEKA